MSKRGSAEVFLKKAAQQCLKDYRCSYLILEKAGFMCDALCNVLMKAVYRRFEEAKIQALRYWGSIEVDESFENLRDEFHWKNLQRYQVPLEKNNKHTD